MTIPPVNTSVKTTKIAIPHPLEEDCAIAGVLEQVAPDQPTQGRKIALVSVVASARCPECPSNINAPPRSSMARWGENRIQCLS